MVARLKVVTAVALAACVTGPGVCGEPERRSEKPATAIAIKTGALPTAGQNTLTSTADQFGINKAPEGGSQAVAKDTNSTPVLKGTVEHTVSPFIEHAPNEVVPEGTAVNLTLQANINSEVSNVGDGVAAMVAVDHKDKDGKKVVLPGQWLMVGKVSRVERQKRGGRDGYMEIKFDKLISPDGKYQVPVEASVSTKDSAVKSVARHVAKDTAYMGIGAFGGALLSVQLGGIGTAIATHGISVGVGAAAGAGLGAVAAARRKGKILAVLPGDEIKVKLAKPLIVPAFNPEALPSAAPPAMLENFEIKIKEHKFLPDPYGDKLSRLLAVSLHIKNKTGHKYEIRDLAVLSDRNQMYLPYASPENMKERTKSVPSGASCDAFLTFGVGIPKHKYRLILMDRGVSHILSEVPIN